MLSVLFYSGNVKVCSFFRLIVKLSLAYVPKIKRQSDSDDDVPESLPPVHSSSRSEPLDLLLYDSLCWDCETSGKCSIRTKVFSLHKIRQY